VVAFDGIDSDDGGRVQQVEQGGKVGTGGWWPEGGTNLVPVALNIEEVAGEVGRGALEDLCVEPACAAGSADSGGSSTDRRLTRC
jgi:hypothetical protein